MNESSKSIYEFGPFRIDVQHCLLSRDGVPVRLTPKVFGTLLHLVESGGRVMRKQEMMDAIWPDSYVEESNLAQNIFLLRRILGEGKNDHQYIITIPGSGYRFVARVRALAATPGANGGAITDDQTIRSLAVLPFKPFTENETDKSLGVRLADALITRLSSLREIRVLSTAAVLRVDESAYDPCEAGRELGVDALLAGLYQREGEQLRVSVQLVGVRDSLTTWAAKFDEKFTNLFAIQDSVTQQISTALELKLSDQEPRRLSVVRDTRKMSVRRCS
jgi:DNA-binding winged helix-turn-helix (wHTH) protein